MRLVGFTLLLCSLVGVVGCAEGNIRAAADYHPPAPPPVRQAHYDPYPAYGSAPAIWRPTVASQGGTIVRPNDPVDQVGRPDYEHAPWSIDGLASKAGTF